MKRKILGIAVAILAMATLAVPVMAKPTKGQKAAVIMRNTTTSFGTFDDHLVGNVLHRDFEMYTTLIIEIYDDEGDLETTLEGTSVVDRKTVNVLQPNKWDGELLTKTIMIDYYVITITLEGGEPVASARGFEGNDIVVIDGIPSNVYPWIMGRANALFHGTGAYEGQTFNFKEPWGPAPAPIFPLAIVWDGYLLKP
jgi:hypothetical protein